jgi:hypothetical protein
VCSEALTTRDIDETYRRATGKSLAYPTFIGSVLVWMNRDVRDL